jgi:hypothetical protein
MGLPFFCLLWIFIVSGFEWVSWFWGGLFVWFFTFQVNRSQNIGSFGNIKAIVQGFSWFHAFKRTLAVCKYGPVLFDTHSPNSFVWYLSEIC